MKKHKKKRTNFTHKDVQLSYLDGGIDSIEKLYQDGKVSVLAIRRACNNLKAKGAKVNSFETWVEKHSQKKIRGRKVSALGIERAYKAQQIHKSGSFLRLPLNALEVNKGQVISATFQKDRIIVKKVKELK